jgi:hypothetical protein
MDIQEKIAELKCRGSGEKFPGSQLMAITAEDLLAVIEYVEFLEQRIRRAIHTA